MLFGRRKHRSSRDSGGPPPSAPSERAHREKRSSYRRPDEPARKRLVVSVQRDSGSKFPGELVDISVGGASARFTLAQDPGLARDDVVELCVHGPQHPTGVRTPARVIHVEQGGAEHWRYGFDFIDVGGLYAQLDDFYAEYFNRRRAQRVEVPPERRIVTRLEWSGGRIDCPVHDLSATGMSVLLSPEKAARIEDVEGLHARLRLPDVEPRLSGPVLVQHRTPFLSSTLLGLAFDLYIDGGFCRFETQLLAYVHRRGEEIARWEAALSRA